MHFKIRGLAITVFFLTALAGCAASVQNATMGDGRKGMIASCGGTGATWSPCNEAAVKACPAGFDTVDREQFVHEGFVKRNLYFTCK